MPPAYAFALWLIFHKALAPRVSSHQNIDAKSPENFGGLPSIGNIRTFRFRGFQICVNTYCSLFHRPVKTTDAHFIGHS